LPNYTLMHKDIEVAELTISEPAAAITGIGAIRNPEHMPLGVQAMKGGADVGELNDWFRGRSIPAGRSGIRNLLARLGRSSAEFLILHCHGLSLSDHYWIRPAGSGLAWGDINFFENGFSKDVGDLLFGRGPGDKNNINLLSPDNTSDGWLQKKWIISGGRRMLVKGSSEPWKQEPFNEAAACAVMRRLGIPHVPYSVIYEDAEPYSVCKNFLTVKTELIPAWRVFHSYIMGNNDSDYSHFLRCCGRLGIPGAQSAIDKMLTLDFVIANEDRHYNNFGFVRDADTLEWLGAAPVYDSGTSLWHNAFDTAAPRKCQPFAQTHEAQIKLASGLSWFDIDSLDGLESEIIGIFSESRTIGETRAKAIAGAVLERARFIEKLAKRR